MGEEFFLYFSYFIHKTGLGAKKTFGWQKFIKNSPRDCHPKSRTISFLPKCLFITAPFSKTTLLSLSPRRDCTLARQISYSCTSGTDHTWIKGLYFRCLNSGTNFVPPISSVLLTWSHELKFDVVFGTTILNIMWWGSRIKFRKIV